MRIWPLLTSGRSSGGPLLRSYICIIILYMYSFQLKEKFIVLPVMKMLIDVTILKVMLFKKSKTTDNNTLTMFPL